jgi:hypothetical protein
LACVSVSSRTIAGRWKRTTSSNQTAPRMSDPRVEILAPAGDEPSLDGSRVPPRWQQSCGCTARSSRHGARATATCKRTHPTMKQRCRCFPAAQLPACSAESTTRLSSEGRSSDHRGILAGIVSGARLIAGKTWLTLTTHVALAKGHGLLVEGDDSCKELGGRLHTPEQAGAALRACADCVILDLPASDAYVRELARQRSEDGHAAAFGLATLRLFRRGTIAGPASASTSGVGLCCVTGPAQGIQCS